MVGEQVEDYGQIGPFYLSLMHNSLEIRHYDTAHPADVSKPQQFIRTHNRAGFQNRRRLEEFY